MLIAFCIVLALSCIYDGLAVAKVMAVTVVIWGPGWLFNHGWSILLAMVGCGGFELSPFLPRCLR